MTNEILAPFGKELTWEIKCVYPGPYSGSPLGLSMVHPLMCSRLVNCRSQLMGKPQHISSQILIDLTGVPLTSEQVMSQMKDKLEAAFRIVRPLPGVERLVAHLAAHKIPIAIATGSKGTNYDVKTAHLGHLFCHFERGVNLIVGDDPILEGKGKPDPKIFLEAGKLLGFVQEEERRRVLVFEDGIPGVRAARSAGMEG